MKANWLKISVAAITSMIIVIIVIEKSKSGFAYVPLILTTTGSSGTSTWNANTSTLNVPVYWNGSPVRDTLSSARAFNTAYQMSTTNYVEIVPSFQISCSLSLTGGTTGTVFIEDSVIGGPGWVVKGSMVASNTGSLTIGLNTVQISGGALPLFLAPTNYWRLRTNSGVGTPVFTMAQGNKATF